MKILCTCPGFVGVMSVFRHGESLGLWDFKRFEDIKLPDITKYDLVILGSWINEYNFIIDYVQQNNTKIGVLITSSMGQVEMSPDYVELSQMNNIFALKKVGKIDYVFIGSKPMYECLKSEGVNLFPYPFNTKLLDNYIVEKKNKEGIGLFLPTASRKNILNQLYAFRLMNGKMPQLQLHTNVGIKLQIGLGYNYYDFLPDEEFFNLVKDMNLNLHVSHTESFCYFFAESLTLGTPCLISPCIADNFRLSDFLRSWLLVKNPDSIIEIHGKISDIVNMDKKDYVKLCKEGKKFIEGFSKENNKALKELLQNL